MEIADNQHPIDLSRKCGYYESQSYKSIPPRPLPDLIPISALTSPQPSNQRNDSKRFDFASNSGEFQFKEQSKLRKELSRFRSVPHLSKPAKISRLKSNSDPRICSIPGSHYVVPVPEKHYSGGKYHSSFSNHSPFEQYSWKSTTESVHSSVTRKPIQQGPGVSLTTIQSLRKLLDKRKSLHKDS